MKTNGKITAILVALLLAVFTYSCKSDDDDTTVTPLTQGAASEAVTKMTSISNNFVPSSMAYSSSSSSSLASQRGSDGPLLATGDDPCANSSDLYACQAVLVKLYMKQANTMFDATINMLGEITSNLDAIPTGTSGNVDIDDGNTLHYSKSATDTWDLLLVGSGGTFLDISVSGDTYTMKMDMTAAPDQNDVGQIEISATYTDENTWRVAVTMVGQDCDTTDPRAPKNLRIILDRGNGLYTGKAMLYSPRWAYFPNDNSAPTCSLSVTDDLTMNLYTDFVANATAAKVKVYMMKRTVSDLSSIDEYAMGNLCNSYYANFKNASDGQLFADAAACIAATSLPTTYPNPFCTTGPESITWGNDCTSVSSTIAGASYSSADDWIVPSSFYTTTITLRSSLN